MPKSKHRKKKKLSKPPKNTSKKILKQISDNLSTLGLIDAKINEKLANLGYKVDKNQTLQEI